MFFEKGFINIFLFFEYIVNHPYPNNQIIRL